MHAISLGEKVSDRVLEVYVPTENRTATLSIPEMFGIKKYLTLFFYPEDDTKVCTTMLDTLARKETLQLFAERDSALVTVSTDPVEKHRNWAERFDVLRQSTITMVADQSTSLSRQIGMYNERERCADRGYALLDRALTLRNRHAIDMNVGGRVEWTLDALDQIRAVDKNPGHYCPTGYTPGNSLIR